MGDNLGPVGVDRARPARNVWDRHRGFGADVGAVVAVVAGADTRIV